VEQSAQGLPAAFFAAATIAWAAPAAAPATVASLGAAFLATAGFLAATLAAIAFLPAGVVGMALGAAPLPTGLITGFASLAARSRRRAATFRTR